MCPTRALSLNDDDTLDVDNRSLCVRWYALSQRHEQGAVAGRRPRRDDPDRWQAGAEGRRSDGHDGGALFDLKTDEDYENLVEFARSIMDFFAENALEHERVGETIDRIGLPAFLGGGRHEPDLNMVRQPRTSCYVRTDDFTDEAEKYFERKRHKAAE